MSTTPEHDPKPQPPEKPLPAECCESGCEVCVYDVYADQLEAYAAAELASGFDPRAGWAGNR